MVYSTGCREDILLKENAATMEACVLVIDDDKHARYLLSRIVRRVGCTVIEAENGEEALRLLADSDRPPIDLVLTDIWMPRMSGVQLLEAVHGLNPDIPVAIITGAATLDTSIAALNAGAYAYLTKPIQPDQVRDVLIRGLHRQEEVRTRQSLPGDLLARYQKLQLDLEALQERQPDMLHAEDPIAELIRGLRHELGNATTAIKLNLSVLEEQGTDNLQEHLQDLQASTDHLVSLLSKLREYPKHRLATETIDLRHLLLSLEDMARSEIQRHRAQLDFVLPDEELPVQGASLELSRALIRILENAMEANEKTGRDQVQIAAQVADESVTLTINDYGPGFPNVMLDKPFSPGYTTKTTGGVMRGLGLGLFVARAVVDLHQGEIWLENRGEAGASVHIRLPLIHSPESSPNW
jgi:signal transduction histidine kinase